MTLPYVALGDSYAAGVGAGRPRSLCWRSLEGYPVTVAGSLGLTLAYQACLGATTHHVHAHQLDALSGDTTLVTLTIGGNDIGFVPVLLACAEPAWMSDSDSVIDHALAVLRQELPGRLDTLLGEVTTRAPHARRVVTAYPRLFAGIDCSPVTFFTGHEMDRLNAAADELAVTIDDATRRTDAEFVDVRAPFAGHAVCQPDSYLNGVKPIVVNSFHPDTPGHEAYAAAVLAHIGATGPTARATEAEIVDGPCLPTDTPVFRVPDLTSARSLAGAAAHGLDPAEVLALGRRLEVVSATGFPDVAASERLHAMDAQVRAASGRP